SLTAELFTPGQAKLRHHKQRLAFYNRVVVWKGVKSLNLQAAVAGFHIDVTERTQRHAAAGIEAMEHSLADAVDAQCLLKCPENFGADRFKLEIHFVSHAAAAF